MVTLIGIISYICFRMPAWYDITSLNEFDREDKSGITSGWHLCYLLLWCCKIGVFYFQLQIVTIQQRYYIQCSETTLKPGILTHAKIWLSLKHPFKLHAVQAPTIRLRGNAEIDSFSSFLS